MIIRAALRISLLSLLILLPLCAELTAQAAAGGKTSPDARLEYVVVLSRHGVRSPISKPGAIDQYSAAPWPQWEVQPGYMTPHGYQLMKLFGIWDRSRFSSQGLFAASGCGDASHVTIYADSDQRTRETGKAFAEGMFPGCPIAVHAQAEGTSDPLFNAINDMHPNTALAMAAIGGRIGGNAANVTEAYRPQLIVFDNVLAGCGHVSNPNPKRISVFSIPASLAAGSGSSPDALRGPLALTITLTENLLLEYTDGMPQANVGWGCVDEATLRELMQLSEAAWNYRDRTPAVARMYAANLLSHIERSMEQKIGGKPLAGALGKPEDRMLLLVGHDTNIATVAGALGIDWIEDGRADDTPPGGALLFELWRSPADAHPFVRVEYIAQTLEQMRNSQQLTPANPPAQAPVFVPGCSHADMSCTWDGFSAAMRAATDPAYVSAH
jgi:4-phytase/acid phosphatase